MYKQLVINAAEHETRVALLEDGEISDFMLTAAMTPTLPVIFTRVACCVFYPACRPHS